VILERLAPMLASTEQPTVPLFQLLEKEVVLTSRGEPSFWVRVSPINIQIEFQYACRCPSMVLVPSLSFASGDESQTLFQYPSVDAG